ncbi:MAG: hypothetical protein IJD58_13115, partial [Lachnospiraceae bacterium]|nr:hypothetical protein [Lachnospiraceae bacterium]
LAYYENIYVIFDIEIYRYDDEVKYMEITLSSGDYKIIDSGQVFLFREDDEFRMDIDTNKDFVFSIIFKFLKSDIKEMKIDKQIDKNVITITCFNFEDLGTGFSSPMSIAKIEDKEMYLMLWSYLDGDSKSGRVRSIKYTFFLEK